MTSRRTALALLAAAGTLPGVKGAQAAPAKVETIAVQGTGAVGSALGKRWAGLGHKVIYGSRTPEADKVKALVKASGNGASAALPKDAAAKAGIVLSAVPWANAKEAVPTWGDLKGKIIIDPMNTAKMVNGYPGPLGMPTSLAEQLQSWTPGATVVKAFNTLGAATMENAAAAGGPVTIPLAGDDKDAKARIAALVQGIGLEPMDMGPLIAAHFIEGMLALWLGYRMYHKGKGFEFHLRPTA